MWCCGHGDWGQCLHLGGDLLWYARIGCFRGRRKWVDCCRQGRTWRRGYWLRRFAWHRGVVFAWRERSPAPRRWGLLDCGHRLQWWRVTYGQHWRPHWSNRHRAWRMQKDIQNFRSKYEQLHCGHFAQRLATHHLERHPNM